ncbi:MAG: ABC transporter ATP-binding protein [Burkholderiales bacterium]|nr:ABC transporter ATP-binding protein [Burkholderiales bacterium]MDP2239260.1 ABC transporter ATP-binding protein [Burkholderiales bacterium]
MNDTLSTTIVQVAALGKQVTTGSAQLTILRDISFNVSAGEAVAIVGVSGSGKSTLLGLMAGLDTPTSGSVAVNGQDLFALDEDGRAALRGQMMGFVFQSFHLLPEFTALENVMLPLELAGDAGAREAAQALLERVGVGDRLGHYPKQLSGGEQQRVAIARAFVTRPALLLADEPTGNLDADTGANIIELMFELNRERGTTLLLVTHDETLSRRCTRVLRLVGGMLQKSEA